MKLYESFICALIFLLTLFLERKAENNAKKESITIIQGPVGMSEDKKETKTPKILLIVANKPDIKIAFLKLLVQKRAAEAGEISSALIKIIPTV